MRTGRGRAVIACLDVCEAEDRAALLHRAGFDVDAVLHDAREILPALSARHPTLLLSDAILPGGDAVSIAQAVDDAALERYPCMLFVPVADMRVPGAETLQSLGAGLSNGPLSEEVIKDAVALLEGSAHRLSPQRAARLAGLMDRLGVPDHPGREMLGNAAALCLRDRSRLRNLRDKVYPDAGRPLGKTGAQAERAIRHVIDVAWRTGEIDEQARIFGDTIDARRGRPTCGEMIAQLADILRWEGRP